MAARRRLRAPVQVCHAQAMMLASWFACSTGCQLALSASFCCSHHDLCPVPPHMHVWWLLCMQWLRRLQRQLPTPLPRPPPTAPRLFLPPAPTPPRRPSLRPLRARWQPPAARVARRWRLPRRSRTLSGVWVRCLSLHRLANRAGGLSAVLPVLPLQTLDCPAHPPRFAHARAALLLPPQHGHCRGVH